VCVAGELGDCGGSRREQVDMPPTSVLARTHRTALHPPRCCVFAFLAWSMVLLDFHYREYVSLRQLYLKGSDGYNFWRELHMAEADGVGVGATSRSKFADIVESAKMDSIIKVRDGAGHECGGFGVWRRGGRRVSVDAAA